ncbi:hypothetical protein ACFV4M_40360, partial [Kitasatospora indigofera]
RAGGVARGRARRRAPPAGWGARRGPAPHARPGRRPGPARTPGPADLCPHTGRGRLSYERAEYLFKRATRELDPAGEGFTLGRLKPGS